MKYESLFFAASAALVFAACAPVEEPGTPVAAEALCPSVADIVCDADARCFPESALSTCVATQVERCEEVLQPLVEDPRLAYEPTRGGAFLEMLGERAASCWEAPIDYTAFASLFAGTGAVGADCTPPRLDAASLRISALSCAEQSACRLYLRADGSTEGVCERRDDDSCSHAYDCEGDQFCSLPSRWQPGIWGQCRPLRADGWACSSDLECASRHCDTTCGARPAIERPLSVPYAEVVLDAEPLAYLRFSSTGSAEPDASGHGHGGELVGGAARVEDGVIADDQSGALALSGDGQLARIAGLDALVEEGAAFSLECWFRHDDVEAIGPLLELWDGSAIAPHVWSYDRGDKAFVNFVDEEAESHSIMSEEGSVSASTWHHVVATYDGMVGRLYLDGRRVGESAIEAPLHMADTLLIGSREVIGEREARWYRGEIDEVAVYSHALEAQTIRRHHDVGVAGRMDNGFPLFSWLSR